MGTVPKRVLAIVLGTIAVIIVLAVSFGGKKDTATTPVTTPVTTTVAARVVTPTTVAPQPVNPTTVAPQPVPPTTVAVPVQPVVPAVPDPPTEAPAAYYKNCDEARAAGAAPIHRGEPGYRAGLDRDGDGTACDK